VRNKFRLQAHLLRNTLSRQVGIGGNKLKSEGFGLLSEFGFHPQTNLLFQLREDAFVISLMGR
jgi:hypothetical protein